MIDFTSHTRCLAKASEYASPTSDFDKDLDQFVLKCPQYQWRKSGPVFIIEPRIESDSRLNVHIEKFKYALRAKDLMRILLDMSELNGPTIPDAGNGIRESHPKVKRKISFSLPAATFKQSLITAAKQSQPSYWLVDYVKIGAAPESWEAVADTYDTPKVEEQVELIPVKPSR